MTIGIFVSDPEAFSEECEEFNKAIAEMEEVDPVENLRQWYIKEGDWEELKIAGCDIFFPAGYNGHG